MRHIVGVQFRNVATVGGSVFGRFGFSDVLTMLFAMDSYVELYKGGKIPMAEFVKLKRDRDILVRVIIKKTPGCFAYQSMRNTKTDFPTLAVAAARINGKIRISVGARPARAMVIEAEDRKITVQAAEELGEYAAGLIPTGDNMRGSAAYRKELVRVLVKRACLAWKA